MQRLLFGAFLRSKMERSEAELVPEIGLGALTEQRLDFGDVVNHRRVMQRRSALVIEAAHQRWWTSGAISSS